MTVATTAGGGLVVAALDLSARETHRKTNAVSPEHRVLRGRSPPQVAFSYEAVRLVVLLVRVPSAFKRFCRSSTARLSGRRQGRGGREAGARRRFPEYPGTGAYRP